jgi:hypothetical protein
MIALYCASYSLIFADKELERDNNNPYTKEKIAFQNTIPFNPKGKSIPYFKSRFWDKFSIRDYTILYGSQPNCLGGLQLNYPKWLSELSQEFGYDHSKEMLDWGIAFTVSLKRKQGEVFSSLENRYTLTIGDHLNWSNAGNAWSAFDRMYKRKWISAIKYHLLTGLNGYQIWEDNKTEIIASRRLPIVDQFRRIVREGDIIVAFYDRTQYSSKYITHILFCIKGGQNPVFAEQMENEAFFSTYSDLLETKFSFGFEAVVRPFIPLDSASFDDFTKTPLSSFNEPIPDGSVFLAHKELIARFLRRKDISKK